MTDDEWSIINDGFVAACYLLFVTWGSGAADGVSDGGIEDQSDDQSVQSLFQMSAALQRSGTSQTAAH